MKGNQISKRIDENKMNLDMILASVGPDGVARELADFDAALDAIRQSYKATLSGVVPGGLDRRRHTQIHKVPEWLMAGLYPELFRATATVSCPPEGI